MKIGVQTWGSDGDIMPFIALCGGLSSAGHDVELCLTSIDNKDYGHYASALGFRISHGEPFGLDKEEVNRLAHNIQNTVRPIKQLRLLLDTFLQSRIEQIHSDSKRLCRENDLVIGHFLMHPLMTASEIIGRPLITMTYVHAGIASKYHPFSGIPDLGTFLNALIWKGVNVAFSAQLLPPVNRLRRQEGLPPLRSYRNAWESRLMNLIAVSSVFCEKQEDWDNHHQVCGFFEPPDGAETWSMPKDLEEFLAAGPPPVYMTLGSMHTVAPRENYSLETTHLLLEAARLAGCRAIVQSSWDDIHDISESPDIYRITRAPYKHIFPSCAAVVHHGGAGTTHVATLSGCPSIIVEHLGDQIFWANELRQLGIAPRSLSRRSVTPEKLAQRIRLVLDTPAMKQTAQSLGNKLAQEHGVRKAVELIENVLHNQRA